METTYDHSARKKAFFFLGKIALFLAPIIILLGLPLLTIYRSGEFLSYDEIAMRRESSSITVGTMYNSPMYYLDLAAILARKPQVLVLGSSRVDQMRSIFFNTTTTVYTAAQVIQQIPHFQEVFSKIPTNDSPKVLIIGLDQKFFDPNYNPTEYGAEDISTLLTQKSMPWIDVVGNWWPKWFAVYYYYLSLKIPPLKIINPDNSLVGLGAVVYGAGFRNDGSYNLSLWHPPENDGVIPDIDRGIASFEYSNTISQNSIDELGSFLAECRARNIYVIGFVPPFSPEAYHEISSLSGKYGYMNLISPDVGAVFKKYNFGFYNFTDPQSIGLTQQGMRDNLHTTEEGSLVYFLKMAETNSVLQQYTNINYLKQRLNSLQK